MTKEQFLRQLEEDLEITSITLTDRTPISDIDEWDSLAAMTTLSIIDEHFGLDFDIGRLNNLDNIGELFEIIGEDKFKS
jgi:acyl carrier protein